MPYVDNDGIHIYYETLGAGPPLLLHHGTYLSLAEWFAYGYVEALMDQFQLVVIDARGTGASDKPHAPEAYSHERCCADVIAVLDALGIAQTHY